MKDKTIQKLLLIYKFILLDESNVKLFDEISGKEKTKLGFDFTKTTPQETEEFLKKWKRENNIKVSDFITVNETHTYKTDANGVPIFIERVNKNDNQAKN